MILPNWMEIHKIPWFQSPPTSSNQCRSRASLSDLSGLNSQRVIPPFTGEVKTYLSEKKNICTDQNPSWFLIFSSWNPNFRLFTTKSPWTSVHQRKSPISMFGPKKISNNHQVLLLTSSFSGYHHWNPHITISDGKNLITIEIPLTSIKPSLHYHVCPSSSHFYGEHVKHICETTNQFCFRHQRARMIHETSWN